jgi:hypothetical protein
MVKYGVLLGSTVDKATSVGVITGNFVGTGDGEEVASSGFAQPANNWIRSKEMSQ